MVRIVFYVLVSASVLVNIAPLAFAQALTPYTVTITNLTQGQSFTSILVLTHTKNFTMFNAGSAPNDELTIFAESGDSAPMISLLQDSEDVLDIQNSEARLDPGESVTLTVNGNTTNSRISAAGVLNPTNDGFFSILGMKLPPKKNKTKVGTAIAYDAGSELNDESCASIPGPLCDGEGLSTNTLGEGFIHVHAGIHGIGDLIEAERDWRNPVARIAIIQTSENSLRSE